MAFQPCPGIASAELLFIQSGEPIENVMHFSTVGDWTSVTLQSLGDTLLQWWTDELSPLVSVETQLAGIVCTNLGDIEGPQTLSAPDAPLFGLVNSGAAANNVTWAIKQGTAKLGRCFRGRTYHVGLTESVVDHSTVLLAHAALLITAYTAIPGAVVDVPAIPVVLSRRSEGSRREEGLGEPLTYYNYTDLNTDSQRCRLPGHRRKRR